DGHGQALRVDLRTHRVLEVLDDVGVAGEETAGGGKRLGEGREVDIDVVLAALLDAGAAAALAQHAEAVGVVDEEAEIVFLLEGRDLLQDALVAAHAEHALRHQEDAAAFLVGPLLGALEVLLDALNVIVLVREALADVQARAVDDAAVALGVIDDRVAAAQEGVDG